MCLLNERDRRQLSTNLWRSRLVLGRNKCAIVKAMLVPLIVLGVLVLTLLLIKNEALNLVGVEQYIVASSTPETNYFISD